MAKGLYESHAQGGPLDGVKLGSGLGWNGRIVARKTEGHVYYHAGYYAWEPIKQLWIWHEAHIPPDARKRLLVRGKPHDRSTYKITK